MDEAVESNASYAETHMEIYATGFASILDYKGMELAVIRDIPDFTATTVDGQGNMKPSNQRRIECTITLPPQILSALASYLKDGVNMYEEMFGKIPPLETTAQQMQKWDSR